MTANFPRWIFSIVIGLVIAALLALQSTSSLLTRANPALSAQLMPLNGMAKEQLASRLFMAGVTKEADIVPSARKASSIAQSAFALEPLSPKAHAVLALAEGDPAKKLAILGAANRLNRRDLLLQGLVLESQVERKDYAATLETLDGILRVHPQQKANFFPILARALADENALPALTGILDRQVEWQEDFLKFAATKPDAIANLAKLRLTRDQVDPEIDQRLIKGLISAGAFGDAYRIYLKATGRASDAGARKLTIDWGSTLAPFDWSLADEAGFRAQPAINSNGLEIFVRSGKGGLLAEQLMPNPRAPLSVSISHSLAPSSQIKDVQWRFSCAGEQEPFFERAFRIRPDTFTAPAAPARCAFINIAIYARSWTGRAPIRGAIDRLEFNIPAARTSQIQ